MRLFIAEKPTLGRAIADALPKPHKKGDGFIETAQGDVVTWCIGHLLEQAEPDAYDAAFKQWRMEHLPIIPAQWQLVAKPKTKTQLTVIKRLIKQADCVVNAGDPDREGQLLVDEVIDFLGYPKTKPVQRCLISDLNPPAVRRALEKLRDNKEFVPLAVSALARSRADWLYGINMTRAYTLLGRKAGCSELLSVGRVQTPLLGLVVRRDLEIEAFVPKPFYEVLAHLLTDGNERFTAKWLPSEACLPWQDEEGRVLNRALADKVVSRINGQPAQVESVEEQARKQAAPLPYNLSSLQIDAAKRFGMDAKRVLDICQSLYERHKLITYPRSDSRYLPTDHFKRAEQVRGAIAATAPALAKAVSEADGKIRSKAWNDSKVDAHHAIIPTEKQGNPATLGADEAKLYGLIARQYLLQFYPPFEYNDSKVLLRIAGGLFQAKARRILKAGWKALLGVEEDDDEEKAGTLPALKEGGATALRAGRTAGKDDPATQVIHRCDSAGGHDRDCPLCARSRDPQNPARYRRSRHRSDPGRYHRPAVQAPLSGASGQEHQGDPDRAGAGAGIASHRHHAGYDGAVGAEPRPDRRAPRQLPAVYGAAHRAAQRPDRGGAAGLRRQLQRPAQGGSGCR